MKPNAMARKLYGLFMRGEQAHSEGWFYPVLMNRLITYAALVQMGEGVSAWDKEQANKAWKLAIRLRGVRTADDLKVFTASWLQCVAHERKTIEAERNGEGIRGLRGAGEVEYGDHLKPGSDGTTGAWEIMKADYSDRLQEKIDAARARHHRETGDLDWQLKIFKAYYTALKVAYKEGISGWKIFYYGPKTGMTHAKLPKVKGIGAMQRACVFGHLRYQQYRFLRDLVISMWPKANWKLDAAEIEQIAQQEEEELHLGLPVELQEALMQGLQEG